jgi:hypothetical protein
MKPSTSRRAAPPLAAPLCLIAFTASAAAQVTYVSQNRFLTEGHYYEPTAYGRSIGAQLTIDPPYKIVSAPDFGRFNRYIYVLNQDSQLHPDRISVRGYGDGIYLGTIGNIWKNYTYWQSHFEVDFLIDQPTPYSANVTMSGNLTLQGPAGQVINLHNVGETQGTLDPGQWKALATAGFQQGPSGHQFDITFVPEPGALTLAATALLLLTRRPGQARRRL